MRQRLLHSSHGADEVSRARLWEGKQGAAPQSLFESIGDMRRAAQNADTGTLSKGQRQTPSNGAVSSAGAPILDGKAAQQPHAAHSGDTAPVDAAKVQCERR